MRSIPIFVLAIALAIAAPAFAGSGEGNNPPAVPKSAPAKTAAPKAKAASADPLPDRAAVASELTRMQQMIEEQAQELAAQRKQIDALRHRIDASGATADAASAPVAVPEKNASLAAAEPAAPVSTESASNAAPHAPPAVTAVVHKKATTETASLDQGSQLPSDIELAGGRIRLGFTVYGDWAWYPNTSFGPQFITQVNQPGPGNDNYNSFEISRTYLNFFYTPRSGAYTLRVTPNVVKQIGNVSTLNFGQTSTVSSNPNGSLLLRIKYAYVQFNHPFAGSSAFGKDHITVGQMTNPLVDWEEGFYGYRFTSLTPWNFLSLSSTHAGAKIGGPIMANGKQYLDYDVGVFDSGSFHNEEVAAEKQVMGRLSVYPMGAKSKYGGLGFTAFVDYGYQNHPPDSQGPSNNPVYRMAFMGHYWAPHFDLLGEYDYGKNAYGAGNLFSGTHPAGPYAYLGTEASSIIGAGSQQRGFDFLGHVDIPHSPFALFGLYQYFQPNTKVSNDPLDFERVVGGISYKYDKYLEFAVDSQNLLFTHSQGTYLSVPNAVPPDINALFINMQVNY